MKVRWTLMLLSGFAATAAWPAVAISADAPAPIELVGGNAARVIQLTPSGSGQATTLVGNLQLGVRNRTATPIRVQLLYLPTTRRTPIKLPGSASKLARLHSGGTSAASTVKINSGAVRVLTIDFSLASSRMPSELNGAIDIDTVASGGATRRLEVPVTAALKPLGDIRFEPSSSVIQVTVGCLLLTCNTSNGGTVDLYGTGVGALVKELSRTRATALGVTLRRSGGRTVAATLKDVKPDPDRAGKATAQLSLDDAPWPGKYTGKLPLSTLVSGSPTLPIEVRSRAWVVWAVLAIFAGVLLSGYLSIQTGLTRRKRQLREIVERAVSDYATDAHKNAPSGAYDEPLVWELPGMAGELKENPDWRFDTELDSPSNIYTAISWARNDADLDEVQAKAVPLALAVKEWRAALTQMLTLRELAIGQPREKREDWSETAVARETDLLLRHARHAPVDTATGAKLLAQVAQQTRWYRHYAAAWDLKQRLLTAGGDPATEAAKVDLTAVVNTAQPPMTRTVQNQDELDVKLDECLEQLNKIHDGTEDTVAANAIRPSQHELHARLLRAQLEVLHATGAAPASAQLVAASAWGLQASTALAKDADEDAQPATPVAKPQREGVRRNPTQLLRRYRLSDVLLSLIVLLITSLVYTATVYSDTWGSWTDWATAFGAGFLGKLVIQWTLLPVYRSLRIRTAGGGNTSAAGADTSAQAAALVPNVGG